MLSRAVSDESQNEAKPPRLSAERLGTGETNSLSRLESAYLSAKFDPEQVRTLSDLENLKSGQGLWTNMVLTSDYVAALQLAEERLAKTLANPRLEISDLVSSSFDLALNFLIIGDVQSASGIIEDARFVVRHYWPSHLLAYELNVLKWASAHQQELVIISELDRIEDCFVELCQTDINKNGVLEQIIEVVRPVFEKLKLDDELEVAAQCMRFEVALVDHVFGELSEESSNWRLKLSQFLFDYPPASPDPDEGEAYLMEAKKNLESRQNIGVSTYILVLAQLGFRYLSSQRWAEAMMTVRFLRKSIALYEISSAEQSEGSQEKIVGYFRNYEFSLRAKVAEGRGRHKLANTLYQRALALDVDNEDDSSIIKGWVAIAENAAAGKLVDVEDRALKEIFNHSRKAYGEASREAIEAATDILSFFDRVGRISEGLEFGRKLVSEIRGNKGPRSLEHITALTILASFQMKVKVVEAAERTLVRALSLARYDRTAEGRQIILSIFTDLAECCLIAKDYTGEYRYRTLAVRYAARIHGADSVELGRALEARGRMYSEHEEFALASVDIEAALKIFDRSSELGIHRSDLLSIKGDIAFYQDQLPEALSIFEQSLEELRNSDSVNLMRERVLLSDISICLKRITDVIPDADDRRRALDYALRGIDIGEKLEINDSDELEYGLTSIAYTLAEELGESEVREKLSLVLARMNIEAPDDEPGDDDGLGERVEI